MGSSSEHGFRLRGRAAGRLIALASVLTVLASACSDGVRTEPGFCSTGGDAGTGGCGESCGQAGLGGGVSMGAMGGTPAAGGESAGSPSEAGSAQGGEAGTGGEAHAGTDQGGTAGDGQGGAEAGSSGSNAKGGTSGSSGSSAKGGSSGNAGFTGSGGAAGKGGGSGSGGAAGNGGGGGSSGSGCPQTIRNATSDTSKSQDQQCSKAYAVNECGKSCSQITPLACLSCELASVDCAPTTDCGFVTGNAQGGPAGGTPRAELCRETMECFRLSNCAKNNSLDCYCGNAGSTCFDGSANGACKAALEASLESEVPSEIANRFGDPAYGGGVALLRVGCDRDICLTTCFR